MLNKSALPIAAVSALALGAVLSFPQLRERASPPAPAPPPPPAPLVNASVFDPLVRSIAALEASGDQVLTHQVKTAPALSELIDSALAEVHLAKNRTDTSDEKNLLGQCAAAVQIYADANWIRGRTRSGGAFVVFDAMHYTADDKELRKRLQVYGIPIANLQVFSASRNYSPPGSTGRIVRDGRTATYLYGTVPSDTVLRLYELGAARVKFANSTYTSLMSGRRPVE